MKIIFVLSLLAIGLFVSCKNTDTKKNNPKKLEKVIDEYIDSLNYFDESCLIDLEKTFIKYKVWEESTQLIEGAEIFPNQSNKVNAEPNDKFISLLFKIDEDLICETYLYYEYWNSFIPIRMKDEGLVRDTSFMIWLHFKGGGFECGDLFLKGTKEDDLEKNGIFKKQDED